MKPTITWILIADGARARVLSNDGPGKGVHEVKGLEYAQEPVKNADLASDRPGRSYSSGSSARSAMEPQTDPLDKREADFMSDLAKMLETNLDKKAYDRLIITAAPRALGNLRTALSDRVSKKIIHELAKDLTQIPNADIAKHLEAVLAV